MSSSRTIRRHRLPLVTVTTGELITYLELALLGEINLGKLQNTGGQFVTDADVKGLALVTTDLLVHLDAEVMQQGGR